MWQRYFLHEWTITNSYFVIFEIILKSTTVSSNCSTRIYLRLHQVFYQLGTTIEVVKVHHVIFVQVGAHKLHNNAIGQAMLPLIVCSVSESESANNNRTVPQPGLTVSHQTFWAFSAYSIGMITFIWCQSSAHQCSVVGLVHMLSSHSCWPWNEHYLTCIICRYLRICQKFWSYQIDGVIYKFLQSGNLA